MKRLFVLTLLSSIFIVSSCTKDVDYTQLDEDIILQYISDNNLNAEATGSGLYYEVYSNGNGDVPNINSIVTVSYKGTLTDGSIFDQSGASGATFPLTNVIQGWQEGIPLFSEGGSGILLIPSALGYGNQAIGSIPANSVLIFEVTLLNVD
ncbi:MAG: putative FKBP-type peptidyl-prolyl cis-trans isomerase FkpA [Owenweeksia sp. TMED14]|nr:MAG: putative FKBP-type peptidyl-prolyl cis-trans isomerase FkpA [Owenweeksia sp. TMED14]